MKEIHSIAAHRKNEKSCWQCEYQNLGGGTLFGMCTWFSDNGRKDKDIPREKVDVGCKFFIAKMKTLFD